MADALEVAQSMLEAIDTAVANRWDAAVERANKAPGATLELQVGRLRKQFVRELTAVGAATGGTAAVPGCLLYTSPSPRDS